MHASSNPEAELMSAVQELARARQRLGTSARALDHEITRALDWREWVRRKPVKMLCVAFALGALLAWRK